MIFSSLLSAPGARCVPRSFPDRGWVHLEAHGSRPVCSNNNGCTSSVGLPHRAPTCYWSIRRKVTDAGTVSTDLIRSVIQSWRRSARLCPSVSAILGRETAAIAGLHYP